MFDLKTNSKQLPLPTQEYITTYVKNIIQTNLYYKDKKKLKQKIRKMLFSNIKTIKFTKKWNNKFWGQNFENKNIET